MMKHIVLSVGMIAVMACGSDGQSDGADVVDESTEIPEGFIDNGDGTFAVPEDMVQIEVDQSQPTREVIDKAEGRAGVGPTLFSKNFLYTLTLPYGGGASGSVTSIPYKWSLGYIPAGLSVILCRNTTANCTSITGAQSGTVHTFDLQPSNVPFIFGFTVSGAGNLAPSVQGKSDQVTINF